MIRRDKVELVFESVVILVTVDSFKLALDAPHELLRVFCVGLLPALRLSYRRSIAGLLCALGRGSFPSWEPELT